jgi:hypothetical protein
VFSRRKVEVVCSRRELEGLIFCAVDEGLGFKTDIVQRDHWAEASENDFTL